MDSLLPSVSRLCVPQTSLVDAGAGMRARSYHASPGEITSLEAVRNARR